MPKKVAAANSNIPAPMNPDFEENRRYHENLVSELRERIETARVV